MIGIVTPYKIPNYGTKLQAYAMQELMRQYDDAEIIGFVPSSDSRIRSVIGKVYLKTTKKIRTITTRRKRQEPKRVEAINSFDQYYIFGDTIKGRKQLYKKVGDYNALVCGSDQLWAPTNIIADYFTLSIFPNNIPKFSYAASFGVTSIPLYLHSRYKKFLREFKCISVREQQAIEIVKKLSGRNAVQVLDPTMMIEAERWAGLANCSRYSMPDPYLFCYFLGDSEEHRNYARRIAEKMGLKIVSFPHLKQYNPADAKFADYNIVDASPCDFLKLIQNAEIVCTDSFHGTVFSILFERQFYVFERFRNETKESTNSRIYSLLDSFELKKQLITSFEDIHENVKEKIDFAEINKILKAYQEKSFKYLDDAVGHGRRLKNYDKGK